MFQTEAGGTSTPIVSAAKTGHQEKVRHLLLGSEAALQQVIQTLHVLGLRRSQPLDQAPAHR